MADMRRWLTEVFPAGSAEVAALDFEMTGLDNELWLGLMDPNNFQQKTASLPMRVSICVREYGVETTLAEEGSDFKTCLRLIRAVRCKHGDYCIFNFTDPELNDRTPSPRLVLKVCDQGMLAPIGKEELKKVAVYCVDELDEDHLYGWEQQERLVQSLEAILGPLPRFDDSV